MPPLLWSLAVTLLKAGYIVIVAVPQIEDAEQLERRLTLDEKSALRVLIYDPEDVRIYPIFPADTTSPARSRSSTDRSLRHSVSASPCLGMAAAVWASRTACTQSTTISRTFTPSYRSTRSTLRRRLSLVHYPLCRRFSPRRDKPHRSSSRSTPRAR